MYIVIGHNDEVIHVSKTIGYQENGNPLVDGGSLAIAAILVQSIAEVDAADIPVEVLREPYKFCCIDGAFTDNPRYVEPTDTATVRELAAAYTEGVDGIDG